ncbi:hypothetical protein C6A90_17095 [Proteus mirabilis]|nr:hypothetical protein C3940_04480 [Proteus mirabilis]AWS55120.1 hypothetical protein AM356_09925 [Proteus mirabilis]RCE50307.1 hypothetical protein C6A90_17095 [Proteus mirabilis]ROD49816.1 hypothetical protein C4Z11_008605 [Proteus mirabilis]
MRLEKTRSTVSTACSHSGKEVTFVTPKGKNIRSSQNEVFNTLLNIERESLGPLLYIYGVTSLFFITKLVSDYLLF